MPATENGSRGSLSSIEPQISSGLFVVEVGSFLSVRSTIRNRWTSSNSISLKRVVVVHVGGAIRGNHINIHIQQLTLTVTVTSFLLLGAEDFALLLTAFSAHLHFHGSELTIRYYQFD